MWVFGERICETLGDDLQGFVRLWERIHKDSCQTLGEDWEELQDFMRRFARILGTLADDLQGFVTLCETLGEDL